MAYIIQKSRAAQLLIGETDYTSSLISFQVSDSGAFKKGLMTTSGTVILGQRAGVGEIEDYDRNMFKRGQVVKLDITNPDGGTYRHPRGLLYVVSTSYDVEKEQLLIEVGCRLSLAYLTDDAKDILGLVPIPLDPAQQTVQNCAASFASAGEILYQDNQGNLSSRGFFSGDSLSGVEGGSWVSVLGETALSVAPLQSSGAIPDEIQLSYQVPEDTLAEDESGKVDATTETSRYFINYPATIWKRVPEPTPSGEPQIPEEVVEPPAEPGGGGASNCGNSPTPPDNGGEVGAGGVENYYLCSDLWSSERQSEYLPATRVATSTSYYNGPGGQVSYVEQTVEGPEIEANQGYFADAFAFCVSTYGYACNPMGSCPYVGMDRHLLSKQVTYYEYGTEANELVRTIQDSYSTLLSAYTTDDYRAGVENGFPVGFIQDLSASMGMYRDSRVITEYRKQGNTNVQLTTTYSSVSSRGVGARAGVSLDALDGIKTSVRRVSTTTATLDVRPDTVNTATTSTTELITKLAVTSRGYITPPSEAGPYIVEDTVPVPLLSESPSQIESWANTYGRYLVRFTRGDAYGLQIAESMRPEIVDGWYPGMPFRYADPSNGKIVAMRMDACTWGVTRDEAIVVTNGIWIGFSSGTLSIGSNLVGNSTPDMTPGFNAGKPAIGGNLNAGLPNPTNPVAPAPPPSIENDLVGQSFEFYVDVDLWHDISMFTYFNDGIVKPNPTDMEGKVEQAVVPYCTGFIVATGGLLETGGTGSLPIEYSGSIVTDTAIVINADLFS